MNVRTKFGVSLLVGASVVAALFLSTTPASAQEQWISYAVKYVCGTETDQDVTLVRGKYRTEINIHNPHYLMDPTGAPTPVFFFKKIAPALPQGEPPFRPTCKLLEFLEADQALLVNCNNIKAQLSLAGLPITGDLEGFVVIEVPPQATVQIAPTLDVVAVYSARPQQGDEHPFNYHVRTMDVERYEPMNIIGIPNDDPCQPD